MSLVVVYVAPNRTLDQAHCPGTKCPHTQCPAISRCGGVSVCVSVWVPCVALPNGGGSSVGPSPLCGSPVWVPCAGPLCGSPVWVPSVWVPCVGPLCGPLVVLRPCGIYSRDVSRSFTRYRSDCTYIGHRLGRHCEGAIYQQLYSTGSWDSETFNTLSRLL